MKITDPTQRRALSNIFKFLALMLVFTLIVQGTSGATMARVSLVTPSRSTIVEAITGTASVFATDNLEITAPAGLMLLEVFVGVGQEIGVGDEAAIFDMDGIDSIFIREQAALDKMRLDLENLLLNEGIDTTALTNAQRTLARVQEDFENTVRTGEENIAEARETLEQMLADEHDSSAARALRRAMDDYEAAAAKGEENILTAEQELLEILETPLSETDDTALQTARRNFSRIQEDYKNTMEQTESDIAEAEEKLREARTRLFSGEVQWSFDENRDKEVEDAEKALQAVKERAESTMRTANRQLEDATISLQNAEKAYADNQEREQENREKAIEQAQTKLEQARNQAADSLLSAARAVENASYSVSEEVDRARTALETAITQAANSRNSAARQVEDATTSLNTAQRNYQNNLRQHETTTAQNNITLATLELDIAAKQEAVALIGEIIENEGILYSDVAGVVLAVQQAGRETTAAPVITVRDGDGGFEARLTVTQAQAETLAVGNESVVRTSGGSMYYTPTVTGIISSIPQPDENGGVTLTIKLPQGNWSAGQRAEAQIVLTSGVYDYSVPIAAIRSDNEGYFLYSIAQKNTVLGLQNEVVRINVTITARDSDNAAVSGGLGRDSSVIVSSNKAVTSGDRVRVE
ncbi:MAG: hypothetical protein FWG87_03935 [Defluviitaleaceae bacterium]|nr:hypothetical protein [Defluviitaleaceae bacterium]